ncbi:MAG: hypothetical protein HY698_11610 [Deltaproteobacteria bacterium]|nr:hypothetical protein [Deltaproteobacteria bacterium]
MKVRVSDVLRELTGAEFRSDVQVADYWSERNLDLLKHYIFTLDAPKGKKSSVELLHTFCEAFAPAATENRFVVIATYGHGKSHFALTLANFFGRNNGSQESEEVLKAIRHAVPDQDLSTYGFIQDFKHQHAPFLILILRGDEPNDLPTKVHRALKQALPGEALPFWFKSAEDFLVRVNRERQSEADKFLKSHNLDTNSLLAKVRDRQASVRDICVALAQELYGLRPQFDEGLSLQDVVKWVVENQCGAGKRYAGLLFLFDEFSTFITRYSTSSVPGAHLQDLLNGVANAREHAAFVAFAQHDPETVAHEVVRGQAFDNVKKELGRLPPSKRYQLHSSLEEVLESYLRKRDDVWLDLLNNHRSFANGLDDATTRTLQAFKGRYVDQLKWDVERFHKLITLGCYPLHPLATSLLCSVELQVTANPRSVLGFVLEAVKQKTDDPVETDAGPVWVRADLLVDYFKEMLGDDNWRLYRGAVSRLNEPDEPAPVTVLKAMLLLAVGKVSTEKVGYAKTIAELSGLSVADVDSILPRLTERSIIRRDVVTGNYTIAPIDWGDKGERIARHRMEQAKLDAKTLEPLWGDLERCGLGHLPLSVGWGHPDNWYAQQLLVERGTLTKEYLQGVLKRYALWALTGGAKEKGRVLVVWLLAQTEGEVEWYRNNISDLVGSVAGTGGAPLVVMRPNVPSTDLIKRLKWYVALKQFTPTELADAETLWHKDTLEQAEKHLKEAVENFQTNDCEPEVPSAFRARLDSVRAKNPKAVLPEVVRMAYAHGPGQWFDQYKLVQPALVNAVSQVCSRLVQTGKIDGDFLTDKPVPQAIVGQYLMGHWHVMNQHGRAAEPPQGSTVFRAWDALDKGFPVGQPSCSAGQILEKLLNPPFGYDWNTLALLFTTWWSHYHYDLELGGDWQPSGKQLKPRELLEKVANTSIRRREDPTGEVRQLVQDVKSGRRRSQLEAQTQLRTLKDFVTREGVDATLKGSANDACNRLEEALKSASEYEKQATQIRLDSQRSSLNDLLLCLPRVRTLPTLSLVGWEALAPDQIRDDIRRGVEARVEALCGTFGRLKQLEDYANNVGQLKLARSLLDKAGLASLVQKVADAVQALEQAKTDLEGKLLRDAERRAQEALIGSLSTHGTIAELRRDLARFDQMTPQPEVKQLREQKRDAIAQELARLEKFAEWLDKGVDKATSREELLQIRDQALRLQDRYDDTDTRSRIESGVGRCDRLVAFFHAVEEVRKTKRSCPGDFARDIGEIRLRIEATSQFLSATQRAAAESVVQSLDENLATERRRVRGRLDSLRKELNRQASPENVKAELVRAGPDWEFLEEDAAVGLREFQREVQSRIDQARVAREEEAKKRAEQENQESIVKGVSIRVPMSELRRGLATLEQMNPQPEVKHLLEEKRSSINAALDRLASLPRVLGSRLDQATSRRSVENCKAEALQSRGLCDEEGAQKSLDGLLARCKVIENYLDNVEKVKAQTRPAPEEFERDTVGIKQTVTASANQLSEAQRNVADKAIAELEGALAAEQRESRGRLAQLEQRHKLGESASKLQLDLERADWRFLQPDGRDSLEALKRSIQQDIDGNESLQAESHFRRIRDTKTRRKCLETLQRLVEEAI